MTLSLIATIFAIDAPSKNVLPPFAPGQDNSVNTPSVVVTQKPFVFQQVTQKPFVYQPAVQVITQKPFVYKPFNQNLIVQNAYQSYKPVVTQKPYAYKPTVQAYRPVPFVTQKPFVYQPIVQKPYRPVVSQQAYYRPKSYSQGGDDGSYRPSGDDGSYKASRYQ